MQNETLYFDQYGYNSRISELTHTTELAQVVVNEFNALNLFPLNNMPGLSALINGGETYIKKELEKLVTPQTVGNLKQDPAKVVATLTMPSFENLNRAIAECSARTLDFAYLTFDGKTVSLSEDQKDKIKEQKSIIADTPEKEEVLNAAMEAGRAMARLHKALRSCPNCAGLSKAKTIEDYFIVDGENVEFNSRWWFHNSQIFRARNRN